MIPRSIRFRTRIPFPAEVVFQWYERAGALERLTPPWEQLRVVSQTGGIRNGEQVVLQTRIGPFWRTWTIERRDCIENCQFRDVQISGPFTLWEHTHRMEPDGAHACFLEDHIEYILPMGGLGARLGNRLAQKKLSRLFAYRHRITQTDIAFHERYKENGVKKILITGASGLIGSSLAAFLTSGGHTVYRLARRPDSHDPYTLSWPNENNSLEISRFEGFDAVIHLAGENIAGRWTNDKKQRIQDSRIQGTRKLCQILAQSKKPPQTLLCASAIGFYGNRGDEILTEQSAPGADFLAQTCQAWENETKIAENAGIRAVNLRFGVVLTPAGGALATMLPPFRFGLGGVVGGGKQSMSWIALDDVLGAIYHAMMTDTLNGPVNIVSPNPATNREFTAVLGNVLRRPTLLPLPAWIVKIVLGEMGEALLLSSAKVTPERLIAAGYSFLYPTLEKALRHLLGDYFIDEFTG